MKEAGDKEESLIPDYLLVLGVVTSIMTRTKRSIFLKGFLHTEKCASYWELHPAHGKSIGHFSKDLTRNVILPPTTPRVFIIDEEPNDESLRRINLGIRQNEDKVIANFPYSNRRIRTIHEFEISYSGTTKRDRIPLGAHGIVAMIESMDSALQAQGLPKQQMLETLTQAKVMSEPPRA